MVRDRVTDGTRIAQLLASEVTGLDSGPLSTVSVVDADDDATPSESGTRAYRLARDGEPFGSVVLYPSAVEIHFAGETPWPDDGVPGTAEDERLDGDGERRLRIESGAAVKRAVDALRSVAAVTYTGRRNP